MATIQNFEDLKVWQKSRVFCQEISFLITDGKFARDFALIDQINRSSGSIMDNIAEGFGRMGDNEFINSFLIPMLQLLKANPNCIEHLIEII